MSLDHSSTDCRRQQKLRSRDWGPAEYSYPGTSPLLESHIQKMTMLKPEASRGASDNFNISVELEYRLIAKKSGHAELHW
jgi:hypothetical protein